MLIAFLLFACSAAALPKDASTDAPASALSHPHPGAPYAAALLKAREHLGNGVHDDSAVALSAEEVGELAAGIATLKGVRADVASSSDAALHHAVREQVVWDLDKVLDNVERVHSQALSPAARAALVKAAQLRVGVLLTPTFWVDPINRETMREE